MARPQKVSVTYAFGHRDRVDPKLAPFGVLKLGKNLRVRKDGRLGVRNGYVPLSMSTVNGSLVAYDLHEYQGRLLAIGSDAQDGYPTDLFEYVGSSEPAAWRGIDPVGQRVTLNPFTNLREVAGIPQSDDGVSKLDAASGAGCVCLAYATAGSGGGTYVIVVDAATDQTLHAEKLPVTANNRLFVVFSVDTFYVAVSTSSGGNFYIDVYSYTPHSSTSFTLFIGGLGSSPVGLTSLHVSAVSHATTARLVIAMNRASLLVVVYDALGSQVGSSIVVAGPFIVITQLAVEADQVDDTINLLVNDFNGNTLRTYDFAGALLNGPTTVTDGVSLYMGRLTTQTSFDEHIAVAVNDGLGNVVIQFWDQDTHTLTSTTTVQRAYCTSRLISGQSENQPIAIVFAGVVGRDLDGTASNFERDTNALFFVTPDVAHMTTRDIREVRLQSSFNSKIFNLDVDPTTGAICWLAGRDPGVRIELPVVTLVDFKSTARRQSAGYGGLLYFTGGTPSVYDGRFPVGLNFNEFPYIISATSSNGAGSLSPSANYSYIVSWEYTLADGSVVISPVSDAFDAPTLASHDTMTVVVATPHTLAIAAGDALFGANVSVVLWRIEWNPTASTPYSIYRRAATVPAAIGMSHYGETVSIVDTISDADLGDEEPIYTQSDRAVVTAPLQHHPPLACSYIAATDARLMVAGLARPNQVQISKAAFLEDAFEFSPLAQFFSLVSGAVLGVRQLDGAKLVFTRDAVYVLSGEGPDDIGVGVLSEPSALPSPGGLRSSWSFLDAPDGLWFQCDDSKLFRIPRGGGAPTWEGIDVQDTLVDFPNIVGAAKHRRDSAGLFACSNDAFENARLLVRDFRTEQWFTDEPLMLDGGAVEAITSFGDTVAYSSFGTVFVQVAGSFQDFSDEFAQFIPTRVVTHPLYPFGLGGYGQIYELLLTGEYRDDCRLDVRVSYDDGLTYTGLESFDLVDLQPGQTIQRKWTLPQDITSSIVIEFEILEAHDEGDPEGRGPTEGFVFNQVDLLVGPEEGLRELSPDEMA